MSKYQDLVDVVMDSLPDEHPWEGNVKMLVDNLIANDVTIQRWIPVTERLPQRNTEVLVCDTREDYVSVWEYMGDGLWYGNDVIWATEDITHWMPLPDPPKGE